MKNNLLKLLIKGTILSILVFFSISFLSLIYSLNDADGFFLFEIGFPFKYFSKFHRYDSNTFLASTNNREGFILDCLITWIVVVGFYLFFKRNTVSKTVSSEILDDI